MLLLLMFFFFSSRRRHTRFDCDWSSDVCSSDLWQRYERGLRAIFAAAPVTYRFSMRWPEQREELQNESRSSRIQVRVARKSTGRSFPAGKRAGSMAEIGRASCRERV